MYLDNCKCKYYRTFQTNGRANNLADVDGIWIFNDDPRKTKEFHLHFLHFVIPQQDISSFYYLFSFRSMVSPISSFLLFISILSRGPISEDTLNTHIHPAEDQSSELNKRPWEQVQVLCVLGHWDNDPWVIFLPFGPLLPFWLKLLNPSYQELLVNRRTFNGAKERL